MSESNHMSWMTPGSWTSETTAQTSATPPTNQTSRWSVPRGTDTPRHRRSAGGASCSEITAGLRTRGSLAAAHGSSPASSAGREGRQDELVVLGRLHLAEDVLDLAVGVDHE